MDYDDVVYVISLLFCLVLGYPYRQIKDKNLKKWTGTVLGLAIVSLLSGFHVIHPLLVWLVNSIIIMFFDKTKCHIISFLFSFLYLFFFRTTAYFGLPYPPAYTNIIHMILTLKMVGLALEIKCEQLVNQITSNNKDPAEKELKRQSSSVNPSLLDIFHYSFNYIGIITGPYFRYRTFQDYINLPFAKYANSKESTIERLKIFPITAVLFLITSSIWPISYATSDEFYEQRSWLYRLLYVWINFFIFRMRMYSGLILSECICVMAGLGAYPEITKPKPGHGPTENFVEMNNIANDSSRLATEKYNFKTVHNIDPYNADFSTTGRAGMKNWNMCIQYWLAINVYKCFPYRKFRTAATMLVSACWHGIYSGHLICFSGVALYVPVEDLYVDLFLKRSSGAALKFWEWFIWYLKMEFLGYLCIAMQLLTFERVMRFYNSIYHYCLIELLVLYMIGLTFREIDKSTDKTDKGSQTQAKTKKQI